MSEPDKNNHLDPPMLRSLIDDLREIRTRARETRRSSARRFPKPEVLTGVIADLAALLYPRRLGGFSGDRAGEDAFVAARLHSALSTLRHEVGAEVAYWQEENEQPFDANNASTIVRHFAMTLPNIRQLIDSDLVAALVGDPAARSIDEILVSYPGVIATLHHRIAHELYKLGATIVARLISELAHARTGIDIHPGATIGAGFFIDHGTGVVVGETAIIGANVRLYQHVTLGARGASSATARERHPRHPIVENDVVIYAGATIMGRVTIGRGSTIGGNVWLLDDVPPASVVVLPEARIFADNAAELVGGAPARSITQPLPERAAMNPRAPKAALGIQH